MRKTLATVLAAVGLAAGALHAEPAGARTLVCTSCDLQGAAQGAGIVPPDHTLEVHLRFQGGGLRSGPRAAVNSTLTFKSYGATPATNEDFVVDGMGSITDDRGTTRNGTARIVRRGLYAVYTLTALPIDGGEVIARAYLNMANSNFTALANRLAGDVHVYSY